MKRVVIVAASAAVFLGGCAAAGGTTPVQGCTTMVTAPPPLVYPVSGATVADGNFALVVGSNPADTVALTTGGGTPLMLSAMAVPSPLPTPYATPQPPETLAAYAVPALASHSTYQITATTDAGQACASTSNLGSFTTQ